jgi:hypothetical protein
MRPTFLVPAVANDVVELVVIPPLQLSSIRLGCSEVEKRDPLAVFAIHVCELVVESKSTPHVTQVPHESVHEEQREPVGICEFPQTGCVCRQRWRWRGEESGVCRM